MRVAVVDSREDAGVLRLRAGDGAQGVGTGRAGVDDMQCTNLRSDSS